MNLKVETKHNISIIYLEGRLTINNVSSLEEQIDTLFQQNIRYFIFNLRLVEYISSSGLRVFISTYKRLKQFGGELKLSEPTTKIIETLKTVGLTQVFEFYDTVDNAMKSLQKKNK